VLQNAVLAFVVGGAICAVGQVVLLWLLGRGLKESQAVAYTAAVMIGVGATLTGAGVYDEIGRVGGMGSALPITGFANSIVSPAMEYKREGFVLGVTAKMFNVAGPVIVYGLLTAALVTAALLVLR
jgi:stage V sporulation protein AC